MKYKTVVKNVIKFIDLETGDFMRIRQIKNRETGEVKFVEQTIEVAKHVL